MVSVVVEPPIIAEVSTEDEMVGVVVPPTVVNATTAVDAGVSMEAVTAVAALPSTVAKTTKISKREIVGVPFFVIFL